MSHLYITGISILLYSTWPLESIENIWFASTSLVEMISVYWTFPSHLVHHQAKVFTESHKLHQEDSGSLGGFIGLANDRIKSLLNSASYYYTLPRCLYGGVAYMSTVGSCRHVFALRGETLGA